MTTSIGCRHVGGERIADGIGDLVRCGTVSPPSSASKEDAATSFRSLQLTWTGALGLGIVFLSFDLGPKKKNPANRLRAFDSNTQRERS